MDSMEACLQVLRSFGIKRKESWGAEEAVECSHYTPQSDYAWDVTSLLVFKKTTDNVFLASNFQIYVSYSVFDMANLCVLFLRNNDSLGSILQTPVLQARSTTFITFIYCFTCSLLQTD